MRHKRLLWLFRKASTTLTTDGLTDPADHPSFMVGESELRAAMRDLIDAYERAALVFDRRAHSAAEANCPNSYVQFIKTRDAHKRSADRLRLDENIHAMMFSGVKDAQ